MKIDQLYFTRTDGESSGWKFVNITNGITEEIKQGFQGIHTHTPSNRDMYSFDIYNNKYYLSKVTSDGTDDLGRAKCFIHGYVFSSIDRNYIFNNYTKLLNLDNFAKNVDNQICQIEELPETGFDLGEFKNKLNLHNLMEVVYEAILSNNSLYILDNSNNGEILIKAIMCAVYEFLPICLRNFVSFSSCEGGLMRKITVTNSTTLASNYVYNFSTGSIDGCNGKYKDFINLLLNNPERQLSIVQKYIEDAHETSNLNIDVYNKAFNFVVMQNSSADSVGEQEVLSKLTDLLLDEKFNNQSDASYMTMLISRIIDNKMNVSSAVNSMITGAYTKTNNNELKDMIVKYIVYSYTRKCSATDFEKFQKLKTVDLELYKRIANETILNGAADFIRNLSISALKNNSDSLFITDECSADCVKIICEDAAKFIVSSENGLDFINKIVDKSIHKPVIDYIVLLQPNKKIMWSYLKTVLNDIDAYRSFAELQSNTIDYFVLIFINEVTTRSDNGVSFLNEIYRIDTKFYTTVETKLSELEKYNSLDDFYADILLNNAVKTDDIIELYNQLKNLSKQTNNFSKKALTKYINFCKTQCKDLNSTFKSIDKLKTFVDLIGENTEPYVSQIKEYFWQKFCIESWEITSDYSELFIEGDLNSQNVQLLQKAVKIFQGEDNCDSTVYSDIIYLLSNRNSQLNAKSRDEIIGKLKLCSTSDYTDDLCSKSKSSNKNNLYYNLCSVPNSKFNMNMDMFLLLHYSNIDKHLEQSMSISDVRELIKYIEECTISNRSHLLNEENVIVDLYAILYKKAEESPKKKNEYSNAVKKMTEFIDTLDENRKKIVNKKIKKMTQIPDYTWISTVSLLLIFVTIFWFVGTLGLSNLSTILLKIVIFLLGITVVGTDALLESEGSGTFVGLITQFCSGIALFITLIVAVTNLF